MAGIVGVFATLGEHVPIFRRNKITEPSPEGEINRLHYRATCIIVLVMCLMVTCTEWIAGKENLIDCLHNGPIPDNVINNYCYIMGTFSVPKHYVDDDSTKGRHIVETGVGPYDDQTDFVSYKSYYQWVPFVLFLQGLMFYAPHLIFKSFEGGKIRLIIAGMNQWVLSSDDRSSKEQELSKYLISTHGLHNSWYLKIMTANFIYLFNVIGQLFSQIVFLGYEFSKYGIRAASFLDINPERRVDPMSRVFPRMTKCTFLKYGPSGSLQKHDAQCLLPINIINEKIYVFLWFWFGFLATLTVLDIIWKLILLLSIRSRRMIIKRKLRLSPNRDKLDVDVDLIVDFLTASDWKLLYHILRNMDSLIFGEFAQYFTHDIRRYLKEGNCYDCLSLKSLLSDEDEKPMKNDKLLSFHDETSI
ncbi:LOW QUALITY PROTEIN: innexin inx2-like [Lepeophtheirus salmonis]|uniref:LOW QUALITY PROTEIN: innexin inx2-like n=1 Tax=Lepeophtheirus salmonis TaxID=72036 RepID=UPI003AF35181